MNVSETKRYKLIVILIIFISMIIVCLSLMIPATIERPEQLKDIGYGYPLHFITLDSSRSLDESSYPRSSKFTLLNLITYSSDINIILYIISVALVALPLLGVEYMIYCIVNKTRTKKRQQLT